MGTFNRIKWNREEEAAFAQAVRNTLLPPETPIKQVVKEAMMVLPANRRRPFSGSLKVQVAHILTGKTDWLDPKVGQSKQPKPPRKKTRRNVTLVKQRKPREIEIPNAAFGDPPQSSTKRKYVRKVTVASSKTQAIALRLLHMAIDLLEQSN